MRSKKERYGEREAQRKKLIRTSDTEDEELSS